MKINNTNGTLSKTACKCRKNLIWNSSTLRCSLVCIQVPYGLPANGSEAPSTCRCQSFYMWNIDDNACYLNCTSVFASNGIVYNNSRCGCKYSASMWSAYYFKCIPKCWTIPFSDGLLEKVTGIFCGCLNGRKWQSHPPACVP